MATTRLTVPLGWSASPQITASGSTSVLIRNTSAIRDVFWAITAGDTAPAFDPGLGHRIMPAWNLGGSEVDLTLADTERLSQSRFGRSRFGTSRFSGAVLGEAVPAIITGTAPVLAALEGGDTLSTAVTWGSYASSAGTIVDPTVKEMSVNGAAYVTYDGATVVAADDTYRLRETVTDSAANERVFVSAVVTVEAVVGPAGTITIDTLTYTRGAAGVAPDVATTVSSTGTTTANYTLWGVLAATAQTKAQIDASPNKFSITAAALADLDGSVDLGNSATDGVISAYITDSSGSPIVSAVVTETGVTYDHVAPAFASAEVGTFDATSLIVTFSKATYGSTSAGDWDVQVNDSPAIESAVAFTPGGTTADITLGAAVADGDTVTVAYTGTGLVGVDAEVVATFTAQSVTNNVAAAGGFATKGAANTVYMTGPVLPSSTLAITFELDAAIAGGGTKFVEIFEYVSNTVRFLVDTRDVGRAAQFAMEDSSGATLLFSLDETAGSIIPTSRSTYVVTCTQNRGDGNAEWKLYVNDVLAHQNTAAASGTGFFVTNRAFSAFQDQDTELQLYSMRVWHSYASDGDTSALGTPVHEVSGAASEWNTPNDTGSAGNLVTVGTFT